MGRGRGWVAWGGWGGGGDAYSLNLTSANPSFWMIRAYLRDAVCESFLLFAPVTTILPVRKISAVVRGSRIRMMTAENRCTMNHHTRVTDSQTDTSPREKEEVQNNGPVRFGRRVVQGGPWTQNARRRANATRRKTHCWHQAGAERQRPADRPGEEREQAKEKEGTGFTVGLNSALRACVAICRRSSSQPRFTVATMF